MDLKDNITLREGRGNASVMFPKVRRKGIAEMLLTPNEPASPEGTMPEC
jgi:hypothetical protein